MPYQDFNVLAMSVTEYTVETGLLAHVLIGLIAELYTLIFEDTPKMQSFSSPTK